MLHRWLDTWTGVGLINVGLITAGVERQGSCLRATVLEASVEVTEDNDLPVTAGDRRHKVGGYAATIAAKRANRRTTGAGPELTRDRSGTPSVSSSS